MFTGILVYLAFDFGVSQGGLSAAQRRTRQTDTTLRTEFITPGLIDSVRQHRAGIAAKFASVILHSGLEIAALIEIALAGLLQIGVSIHDREMEFLSEFCGIGMFSLLNWSDMRLLQRNDSILAGMGVIVVHVLVLAVHR